jgi:hypothetical protein
MKTIKSISLALAMLIVTAFGIQAQNGNVVVADVKVYDMENGTGMIVVHLSGNLADDYPGGTFSISGDRVTNGSASGGIGTNTRVYTAPPVHGNGNSNGNQTVYLAGVFPLDQSHGNGNQNDDVTMDFRFHHRLGNGLDWTYSRVGRIRRTTGI